MSQPDLRTAFAAALEKLNDEQRRAVETIDGPVLVVAGPGTGKTQILTLRIANILQQTDTAPEHVLALTFTDSGAKAMRERLRGYIGSMAYRVPIHTFHGFAEQLIHDYPDAYERVVGGTPLTDLEALRYIESIIDSGGYTHLRPVGNPRYYVKPIRGQLDAMKREYISPERLAEIVNQEAARLEEMPRVHEKGAHKGKVRGEYSKAEKTLQKHQELLRAYQEYEALLRADRRYDFADMIVETVQALQDNETVLRELQETYHYILADEHQDVNESQNQILELLASYHDHPNIFAVGDEKQAIYRFQGASLSNFLYFADRFPGTQTIQLTENYRSGQTILDSAHTLIMVDDPELQALRVPLQAAAVPTATVTWRQFAHEVTEDEWIVAEVTRLLAAGESPQEIALIVRTNRQVEHYAALLRAREIAVQASADSDINTHPITYTVRALLAAVVGSDDGKALVQLLHDPYWGVSVVDVIRTLAARSYAQPLRALLADPELLQAAQVSDVPAVHRIHQVLAAVRERSGTESPHRTFEYLLQASGLLDHIETHDPWEGGRVIRRLYDTVSQLVQTGEVRTLHDVHTMFLRYEEYTVPLAAPYIATRDAAVRVMTAHKSKGLEFATVFVPRVTDNLWGGARKASLFSIPLTSTAQPGDTLDDDRRLLYVAMTRAKTTLHLSLATNDTSGKERTVTRLWDTEQQTQVEPVDTDAFEATVTLPETLGGDLDPVMIDPEILRTLLAARGLSATSLNNYLSSPWNYVYRNVLRVPEIPPLHMLFGTAVHGVLEQVVRRGTAAQTVTQAEVFLRQSLEQLPVTTEEYTQLHEKALNALAIYVPHLQEQLATVASSRVEVAVAVTLETGLDEISEVPLKGMLDRVDYDTAGRVVRVIDYKTGKPKTRNAIEGKTAANDPSYKRQLCFYALLLELQGEYHDAIEFVLSFVEPGTNGVVREETFAIDREAVSAIKKEVVTVIEEISQGSFLTAPCDPKVCDYCDWVAALQNTRS